MREFGPKSADPTYYAFKSRPTSLNLCTGQAFEDIQANLRRSPVGLKGRARAMRHANDTEELADALQGMIVSIG